MKFPYMRRDTKLSLIVSLACSATIGLSAYGLLYNATHNLDLGDFCVILVCSILGLVFGAIFSYCGWASFIEEYDIDKRHERYRTVKTY